MWCIIQIGQERLEKDGRSNQRREALGSRRLLFWWYEVAVLRPHTIYQTETSKNLSFPLYRCWLMFHSFLEVRRLLPSILFIFLRHACCGRYCPIDGLLSYWRSVVVSDANDLVSQNRRLCNASAGGQKDRVFWHSVYAYIFRLQVGFCLSFAFPFALPLLWL